MVFQYQKQIEEGGLCLRGDYAQALCEFLSAYDIIPLIPDLLVESYVATLFVDIK